MERVRTQRPGSRTMWAPLLAWAMLLPWPALAQRNLEPVAVELRLPGQPSQRLYGESHALVIGASNYRGGWSSLPGVAKDLAAVSQLLKQQGFQVTEVQDPTRDQLDAALRNFAAGPGQRPDARLLVYFAGHGHTLTTNAGSRLGYLVPIDAPRPDRDPGGFRRLAYSMELVEVIARQMESRHALFLFDSCFSGTIFRSRSGVPDSISDKTSRPVRQFITAGDADQPVPDESIFRRQLEVALRDGAADLNHDGYVTGTELGSFLEDTVTNYSRRSQTPRWGKIRDPDLDKGDFVFALAPAKRAPAAGTVLKDCDVCPQLVVLPTGEFEMGSPPNEIGRGGDEGPVHGVRIARALAFGRYEVTRSEFARFVATTQYRTEAERNVGGMGCYAYEARDASLGWRAERTWRNPGWSQADNEPVVCVSWNDAQAYLKWLNGIVAGKAYRLPSEAEWEYAARAGSRTRYSWGDDPESRQQCQFANGIDETPGPAGVTWPDRASCSDGQWFTSPAGTYKPNRFGLFDMNGNAQEWVQDTYHANYDGAPNDGTAWLQGGDQARRVLRGGAWNYYPTGLRSASRVSNPASFRNVNAGFRIARFLGP